MDEKHARRDAVKTLNRFMKFAEPEPMSGCWLWTGNGTRYGQFWWGKKSIGAHVASWMLFRGSTPEKPLQVLHKCDNTICVNPSHLFIGTQLHNRQDAVKKGRQARGERVGNAVLTEIIVRTIKNLSSSGLGGQAIANILGLKRVTVSAVTTGRNWKHVI